MEIFYQLDLFCVLYNWVKPINLKVYISSSIPNSQNFTNSIVLKMTGLILKNQLGLLIFEPIIRSTSNKLDKDNVDLKCALFSPVFNFKPKLIFHQIELPQK